MDDEQAQGGAGEAEAPPIVGDEAMPSHDTDPDDPVRREAARRAAAGAAGDADDAGAAGRE